MKNIANLNFIELTKEEMLKIEGGDWLEDSARGLHMAWCGFKNAVSKIYDNYMASGSNTPAMG